MTTYTGTQKARPPHASSASGNAWVGNNKVTVTAAPQTTDVIVGMEVPAGVELSGLRYRSGDMDTAGTTLTMNIGYRSKLPGGALAAAPTAFAAASTAFQAATATWQEIVFAPIKFNEPVEIVLVPAANSGGLSASADLYMQAQGEVIGIS